MVKRNGVFHIKTEQEKLAEQQQQERMEKYAAQLEEEKKATSRYAVTTQTRRGITEETQSANLERRRTQMRDDIQERQVSGQFQSPLSSEQWDGGQVKRFRLNAGRFEVRFIL